ncbi:MAG: hypothetical protein HYV09_13175 [Deltaproteobacteria bacterium]|nr:hypothetical protein [Deltaproteobacteria bacterium]
MSSRCRADVFLALALLFTPLLACGIDLSALSEPEKKPKPVELDPDPTDDEDEPEKAPKMKPIPGAKKGAVDLGTAIYPDGTPKKDAVSFTFDVPPKHKLGYALAAAEQKAVDAFYASYARSVQFKRIGPKSFQWSPPPGCAADMSCVYKKLITRTDDDVRVIAKRFRARADAAKLDAVQLTDLALSYVQQIPYEIPEDPFGLRPPPLVISKRKGDCDSKALLLYMILNELGIEAVILSSKAHAHTMIGVPLPTNGTAFRWKSRKYAFAEVTAKGAPLGYLPPELSSPNDWVVELAP